MVGEGTIIDGPFFVVPGDHVGEQWLEMVEQSIFLEIRQWHVGVMGRLSDIIEIPHHQKSSERGSSPIGRIVLREIPTTSWWVCKWLEGACWRLPPMSTVCDPVTPPQSSKPIWRTLSGTLLTIVAILGRPVGTGKGSGGKFMFTGEPATTTVASVIGYLRVGRQRKCQGPPAPLDMGWENQNCAGTFSRPDRSRWESLHPGKVKPTLLSGSN